MKRRNRLSSKAAAAIAVAVGIRAGSHSPAAPVSEALGAGHEPVPQLTRRLSAGEPHARQRPMRAVRRHGPEHVQQPLPVALVVPDALVVAKHALVGRDSASPDGLSHTITQHSAVGDIPLGTGESMTAVRVEERLSIRVERRSLARHRQIGHGRLRHVPERLPRLIGHHGAGQLHARSGSAAGYLLRVKFKFEPDKGSAATSGFFFRYLRCTFRFSRGPNSSSIGLRTYLLISLGRYDLGTSRSRRKSSRLTFHTPVCRYCLSLL